MYAPLRKKLRNMRVNLVLDTRGCEPRGGRGQPYHLTGRFARTRDWDRSRLVAVGKVDRHARDLDAVVSRGVLNGDKLPRSWAAAPGEC